MVKILKSLSVNEFNPAPRWNVLYGTRSTKTRTYNDRKPRDIGAEYCGGTVVSCEPSGHRFFPYAIEVAFDGCLEGRSFDSYRDAKEFAESVR